MWGRVSRPHGNSGVVKAKFTSNMPAHSFGASARIVSIPNGAATRAQWTVLAYALIRLQSLPQMLFPSTI